MRKSILYFFEILLIFLVLQSLLRLVFFWHYYPLASELDWQTVLHSLFTGIRFDLSITGYIIAPAILVGLLPGIGVAHSKITRLIVTIYLSLFAALVIILQLFDLEFFGYYNTRLNHLLLNWNDTPGIAFRMVFESYPVIRYSLLWLVLLLLFTYLLTRLNRRMGQGRTGFSLKSWIILYPVVIALVFLAIRGRVNLKAPINRGLAYFSEHDFANQMALNPVFTFVRDAILDSGGRAETEALSAKMDRKTAYARVKNLLRIENSEVLQSFPLARIEASPQLPKRDVILLILESEASVFIQSCHGREDMAPEFDRLAEKGLLFNNFFSNGSHTYSGIFSTLTGLPTPPGKSIMKRMEGQQKFSGLAPLLAERGYDRRFYVPHDPHFDNMQAFLIANGFQEVISQGDFPAHEVVSSMGVPDEVLYDRLLKDLEEERNPLLAVVMTGSSHGPYIHPDRPYDHLPPDHPHADRLNAFRYADWALGKFVKDLETAGRLDSTLLVLVGDHGVVWEPVTAMDFSLFRVPLLLIAPGRIETGVSTLPGSQKDIVATVMDVLGGTWTNNTLGKSLIDTDIQEAIFLRDESIGVIHEDYFLAKTPGTGAKLFKFNKDNPFSEIRETTNDSLAHEMTINSDALLSATYYLIHDRQCGLPDKESLPFEE